MSKPVGWLSWERRVATISPFLHSSSAVLLALIITGKGRHPEDFDASASMSVSSDTLTLFLAADGDDENCGVRRTEHVKLLAEVEEQLRKRLEGQRSHAFVRVLPGDFRGEAISWTFSMPDYSTIFFGDTASGRRPIFDEGRTASQKEVGRGRHIWFQLTVVDGSPTNLVFRSRHMWNYEMAILFRGDRSDPEG